MSSYYQKKVYESPHYVDGRGAHYHLEEINYNQAASPSRHSEYVIYLDSHATKKEPATSNKVIEYEETDTRIEEKLREFERSHQFEIEEIKIRILNECKLILERELRSQASAFLIERTSLEKIIKDQEAGLVEAEIKLKTVIEEIEIISSKLRDRDDQISKMTIEISSKRKGEEQTIIDLRLHYEEMIRYQEDKFRQDLEDQISSVRVSYEAKVKSLEARCESLESRISALNKTIEALNQALRDKVIEIENLQKLNMESEQKISVHEWKLKQEFDRTFSTSRRDYEEKLRSLELKIQKYEKTVSELRGHSGAVERLEGELLEWQRKYHFLEKHKPKEIVKEVVVEKPVKVEREIVRVEGESSKKERKWYQERTRLEEEIEVMRTRVRECEYQAQMAEQAMLAKDAELQRTFCSVEELQRSLSIITSEVERVKEENSIIMMEREKIVVMVKNYRRYIKELESVVSEKNRELFQKIRDLDLVISGEEFLVDVSVMPMMTKLQRETSYGYTSGAGIEKYTNNSGIDKKKNATVISKTTKLTSSSIKK